MANPFDMFKKINEENIKEVFNFSKKIRAFEKRHSNVKRKSSLYIQPINNYFKDQKKEQQQEEAVKFYSKLDYIKERLNDISTDLGNSLSSFEQAFKETLNHNLTPTNELYDNALKKIKSLNIPSYKARMANPFDLFKKINEENIKEVFNFSKQIRAFEKRHPNIKRKSSLYTQSINNYFKGQKKEQQQEEAVKFYGKLDYMKGRLNDISNNLGNSLSSLEKAFKDASSHNFASTNELFSNALKKIKNLNIPSHKDIKNKIKDKIRKKTTKTKKTSIIKHDSKIKRLNLELENLHAYLQILNTDIVIPTAVTDKNHKENLHTLLNVSFLNIINNEIKALEEIKEKRYEDEINNLKLSGNKKHKKDFNTFNSLIEKSESSIQEKIDDFLKNHTERLKQTCDFIEKIPMPSQHVAGHTPEYQAYYENAIYNSTTEINMINDLINDFTNNIVDQKYIRNFQFDYIDRVKDINKKFIEDNLSPEGLYENNIHLDADNAKTIKITPNTKKPIEDDLSSEGLYANHIHLNADNAKTIKIAPNTKKPIANNFEKSQVAFNFHSQKNKEDNVSKTELSANENNLTKTIKPPSRKP